MALPAPAQPRIEDVDVPRLSALLDVLANENRLEILRQLREPRAASELRLRPPAARPGENPARPISKQAVRVHLARLEEIGVVTPRPGQRGRVAVDEYVVNQQRLFAIAEEFRRLGSLRPLLPPGVEQTLDGAPMPRRAASAGVRLVLVHGLDEGRTFPLSSQHVNGAGERGWVIGRRRGIAVSLDYDPYVSAENAEITSEAAGRYLLHDLRSSRNGTLLNWERLPKGGTCALATGDVIGAGHSLLLFRQD
jgi:DNA-binding transcriptional ArsR family regulator